MFDGFLEDHLKIKTSVNLLVALLEGQFQSLE